MTDVKKLIFVIESFRSASLLDCNQREKQELRSFSMISLVRLMILCQRQSKYKNRVPK